MTTRKPSAGKRELTKCGGLLHWRQVQGMLLVTALGYTARCSVCDREHAQPKRPKLGQTCEAIESRSKRKGRK